MSDLIIDVDAELAALRAEGEAERARRAEFEERFEKICERAQKIWPQFRRPKLVWRNHGSAAGVADLEPNEIHISPLYAETNREDMLADTIPHEVAHILAYQRYGDRGHGGPWYAMFGALTGRAPKRTHDYGRIEQAKRRLK